MYRVYPLVLFSPADNYCESTICRSLCHILDNKQDVDGLVQGDRLQRSKQLSKL